MHWTHSVTTYMELIQGHDKSSHFEVILHLTETPVSLRLMGQLVQEFYMDVEYYRGNDNVVVDALSRLMCQKRRNKLCGKPKKQTPLFKTCDIGLFERIEYS